MTSGSSPINSQQATKSEGSYSQIYITAWENHWDHPFNIIQAFKKAYSFHGVHSYIFSWIKIEYLKIFHISILELLLRYNRLSKYLCFQDNLNLVGTIIFIWQYLIIFLCTTGFEWNVIYPWQCTELKPFSL